MDEKGYLTRLGERITTFSKVVSQPFLKPRSDSTRTNQPIKSNEGYSRARSSFWTKGRPIKKWWVMSSVWPWWWWLLSSLWSRICNAAAWSGKRCALFYDSVVIPHRLDESGVAVCWSIWSWQSPTNSLSWFAHCLQLIDWTESS